MPVFDIGRAQHHIPLPDDLDRTAPFLGQPGAERNDQYLAQRMGMPVGARTRLKGDVGTVDALRGLGSKAGSTRTLPVKFCLGAVDEGREPAGITSCP